MSTLISSRARLVDLLWQLKQAYDHNNERGYDAHDVRFIHFNMLLNDEEYRNEVIARAALSKDKKTKQLGMQLQKLNTNGELLHKRSSSLAAVEPMRLNQDIADTLLQQRYSRRSRRP